MRLAKLGHSCLLVEAHGARILIDPGVWSDIPDTLMQERLDAILITHQHPDHVDPEAVRRIIAVHPEIAIHGSAEIVATLQEAGIEARDHGFENFEVAGTAIEVLEAGHEAVLGDAVQNAAYRIGGELAITGDSLAVSLDAWHGTRALALVTAAPWAAEPGLARMVDRLAPEVVVPVHDGYLTDGFRKRSTERFARHADERGARLIDLGPALQEL